MDDHGPATVDYMDRADVTQHFRDLLNFSTVLSRGLEVEEQEFRQLLKDHDWPTELIQEVYLEAAQHTIWERMIPPPIHDGND